MKKIMNGILLLGILFLTACGGQPVPEPLPEDGLRGPGEAPSDHPGWTVDMEREVYDPSLTTFAYFIRNETGETAEFGEDYQIRRLEGGMWTDLTPRENWGFNHIGYSLTHGGEMALTCTLDRYEEPPEPGRYQLVKPLGNTAAYVEFQLGKSPYTAETPYGFEPLENLPENYRADTAPKDCVVFANSGMRNPENVEAFLRKSALGVPFQLRAVEDRGDGDPVIQDVIYENGHFLRRVRRSGKIEEQRFSYLVTDGQDLYLSNGTDWASGEQYHDSRALLIPEGTPEMIAAAEETTARRLEGNAARYQIWSADGVWSAALTNVPTEFSVRWQKPGEGSWGGVYDLQNWDGLETSVTGISWQKDGALLLTCGTSNGGTSRLAFSPETERLTSLDFYGLPLAEDTSK